MSVKKSIAYALRQYKEANHLSMNEFAEELGIAVSSLQCYMNGTANIRIETLELIAKKIRIPVIEMVSGPTPEWEQAETIVRAAKELGSLTAEQQEEGIQLFLALVALFAKNA